MEGYRIVDMDQIQKSMEDQYGYSQVLMTSKSKSRNQGKTE